MLGCMERTYPAHHHFPRLWAGRNSASEHTFADGTYYGPVQRREGLRACVRVMRTERRLMA
jgi:hypothetical protein